MSGWTPGPWSAEKGGGKGAWIKGANDEWAALACGNSDETADANARLIAAAPDLAEALAVIMAQPENSRCGCNPHAPEYVCVYCTARAALAKAGGDE